MSLIGRLLIFCTSSKIGGIKSGSLYHTVKKFTSLVGNSRGRFGTYESLIWLLWVLLVLSLNKAGASFTQPVSNTIFLKRFTINACSSKTATSSSSASGEDFKVIDLLIHVAHAGHVRQKT